MPDDDEDFEIFKSLMEKADPEWLRTILKKTGISLPENLPGPKPEKLEPTNDGFLGFLRQELQAAKDDQKKTRDLLEKAYDLLTPEQRLTLRQPKEDGPPSPPKKELKEPPNAKPKRFLSKL